MRLGLTIILSLQLLIAASVSRAGPAPGVMPSKFSMALNGALGRTEGVSLDRTRVRATVTADKGEAGIKIVSSKLEATAYGLKGADAAKFAEIAKAAESKCPVSNAYRGTMQITLEAKVG